MKLAIIIVLLSISGYFISASFQKTSVVSVNIDLEAMWEKAQPAWRDLLYQVKCINENTRKS